MSERRPEEWFTIERAAELCERHPRTIRNLVSKHQLPRLLRWVVRRGKRRRVMRLSPETVWWLQQITAKGLPPPQKPSG